MPGPLAQSVEHLTLNQQVPGSIPGRPTSKFKHLSLFEVGAFLFGATFEIKNPAQQKASCGQNSLYHGKKGGIFSVENWSLFYS
jgi:hypothetical protein